MDEYDIRAVALSMLEETVIPTKRPVNGPSILAAKSLVQRRDELPQIYVAKDIGSDRFLVVFGHNAIAGALAAYDEDPTLGDYVVQLREIVTLKTGDRVLARTELSMMLFDKAREAEFLNESEEVNWRPFKYTVRNILKLLRERPGIREATQPRTPPAATVPTVPATPGAFVEGNSDLIDLALVRKLARLKLAQQKGSSQPN